MEFLLGNPFSTPVGQSLGKAAGGLRGNPGGPEAQRGLRRGWEAADKGGSGDGGAAVGVSGGLWGSLGVSGGSGGREASLGFGGGLWRSGRGSGVVGSRGWWGLSGWEGLAGAVGLGGGCGVSGAMEGSGAAGAVE